MSVRKEPSGHASACEGGAPDTRPVVVARLVVVRGKFQKNKLFVVGHRIRNTCRKLVHETGRYKEVDVSPSGTRTHEVQEETNSLLSTTEFVMKHFGIRLEGRPHPDGSNTKRGRSCEHVQAVLSDFPKMLSTPRHKARWVMETTVSTESCSSIVVVSPLEGALRTSGICVCS